MTTTTRQAQLADLHLLHEVGVQSFLETFASSNSAEEMAKYVEEHFSTAHLQAELQHPESTFYLAFAPTGKCIGYLKLNTGYAQSEAESPTALEIQRIYVLREALGQGDGQALFEQALHQAQTGGHPYLWLGVWEHNSRAIRFYERNGFIAYGEHTFVLGDDPQRDILMKRTFIDED